MIFISMCRAYAEREMNRMKLIFQSLKPVDHEFYKFAENYYKDGLHFFEKGMFPEAFEAFIISWAYLDVCLKLGIINVPDKLKHYFTV